MIYSVLGFIILEAICFIIASLISPLHAQNANWESKYINAIQDTARLSKHTIVVDNGVFKSVVEHDTLIYHADLEIGYIETSTKKVDQEFKALEKQQNRWDKATESEKRKWCYQIVIDKLEGNNYPQRVYDYLLKYAQYAVYEYNVNGILASGTLAQALLETGDGKSSLCTTHNNHFGIKCHEWKKKKVWYKDDCKGKPCCFRAYKDDSESYRDHSSLLLRNRRYKGVLKAKTPYEYAVAVGKSGYATSKSYRINLLSKIEKYDLVKFDVKYNEAYWNDRETPKLSSTW